MVSFKKVAECLWLQTYCYSKQYNCMMCTIFMAITIVSLFDFDPL